MIKRLQRHSDSFAGYGELPKDQITPVEPYEYDGNEFFKQLHKNGTYWIPSEERIAEEERMAGKIARAKLRLREKREQEAEAEKMLRLVYAMDEASPKGGSSGGGLKTKTNQSKKKKQSEEADAIERRRRISEIKRRIQEETDIRVAQFKIKRAILERKERLRKEKIAMRQKEREAAFLGDKDEKQVEIIERYREKMKNLTSLQPPSESESKAEVDADQLPSKIGRKADFEVDNPPPPGRPKILKAYQKLFQIPSTPPNLQEEATFTRLREAFNVSGGNKLSKLKLLDNPVIQKYIEVTQVRVIVCMRS
jgi:hypothetical protein